MGPPDPIQRIIGKFPQVRGVRRLRVVAGILVVDHDRQYRIRVAVDVVELDPFRVLAPGIFNRVDRGLTRGRSRADDAAAAASMGRTSAPAPALARGSAGTFLRAASSTLGFAAACTGGAIEPTFSW